MSAIVPLSPLVRVGVPQHSGPLTVFPLIATAPPGLEYRAFAQAAAEGFVVHEVQHGASVRDLTVVNPLDVAVLLYEGEEVLGAQQNRTLDVTVLVPAGATLDVPVSCVEAGRWDGSRHQESFVPAPQAAHPSLRAMKQRQATTAFAAGAERRADQGAVWDQVASLAADRGAVSDTGALHDVFEHDRATLDVTAAAITRQDDQVGAVVAIGGEIAVIDYVSRSDVWAALHNPLVQGYALDALSGASPSKALIGPAQVGSVVAQDLADNLLRSLRAPRPAVGLGSHVDARYGAFTGTGLQVDGEAIQLTAFPGDHGAGPATRIRRPSRRGV